MMIKDAICNASSPAFLDPEWKICLQTNASDLELGAIWFQQGDNGRTNSGVGQSKAFYNRKAVLFGRKGNISSNFYY